MSFFNAIRRKGNIRGVPQQVNVAPSPVAGFPLGIGSLLNRFRFNRARDEKKPGLVGGSEPVFSINTKIDPATGTVIYW